MHDEKQINRHFGFAAATYAFTVAMLSTTLPTPLYQFYRSEFGFSELMVTVIFAVYALGVIVALLLLGGLSDQVGRRRMLIVGLVFATLSAIVFLLAHGLGLLLLARVLSGFSSGIFTGTATATLLDLSPPGSQVNATLVATLANIGGLGLGPLLAGLLAEFAGIPLRLTFWVDLALLIPAITLIWIMSEPLLHLERGRLNLRRLHVPPETKPIFISASLAASAGFAVLGLFTAVAPGFLGQILGIHSPAIIGLIVSTVFASSVVGQTVLMRVFAARSALVAGCVGLIIGMLLFATGLVLSLLILVIAGAIVSGLGQGLSFRTGLASVNAAAPTERRGEVDSIFFVVAYLAISLPVVSVGIVAELIDLRTAGVIFAVVVAILAGIVIGLLKKAPSNV
ncbi:MAG: major facilitator superfamily 1 [Candidatus Saccharibacteria bacterium]|nr:major facilitator superfamily 1 [Candidatus Saccharibacteria bacterium]